MAIFCRRFYYKYGKCLLITVLIAFFVQILIAINYFPSVNDNLLFNNIHKSVAKQEIGDVSARKIGPGFDDDEDFPAKAKTQNKPVAHLRLEELDFKPICEIKSREAISAIHRAKTQTCKEQIVNKTCLIQGGNFYPQTLPNKCRGKGMTYGKHLGCYQDEKKLRLLSSFYGNYANTNSRETCIDICVQAGFPYAGVQYASECFCGENPPAASAKISVEACDMKCPADPVNTCGGYFTMNVFETGLAKFNSVMPATSSSSDEPVKIIFLLTLNGRALRQVHRLINALYRTNHYFYIHIDARQDYLFRKLLVLEKQFPNIKLATKRFSTIWGGASLLTMLLTSMKDIVNLGWRWDFVINLSESDFPIKSLESIETFLASNKGLNFVKSHGREVQRFIKKQGLDKTFIECETHMWRVGERKLPRGIIIDGGSDWIALSPEFVSYIIGDQDELLAGLDIVFQHTLLPAESFFHTVLRNSRFCNTYVDNNLHVTNWKRKLGCKCQYKHVVDWCGCSPNDFKTEDWPRIQNTQDRQLFFARKFEPIISQEIITRVENFIGFNDHHLIPNLEAYWQSIYDTDDLTASTDDTLLTHAESIVRQNAKILLDKGCSLETDEITEINTYNYADVYKGNLILHKAFMNNGESVMMETWYKPQKHLELNFESSYTDNVKIFKVSSQYDQKEMIFRNLGSILGPLSEPNLLYRFAPHFDKQFENLTILWLDPAGVIADINYIHLEENNLTNFVKPSLKVPLLPGVWKVGLFESKSNLIALTKFLITPLQYFSGKELSHQEANIIHSGSQSAYKNFSYIKPINFLPGPDDSLLLQKISYSNTKRIQQDLREWIDGLTSEFYNVLGSCVASSSNNSDKKLTCGKHSFEYCESTEWSSLSPDPKGFVGKLNTKTGRLERRQDYLFRKLLVLEKQFPNIKLATKRFSTIWGGASLLTMLLTSMKDIVNLGWRWDFVINLSESDFPIKSLESIETFLASNKGLNFVKSHGREVQRFIKKQGLDKTFIECETHMWRVGERKLPRGIIIDGGSDWIALSPEFVSYIIGDQDELLAGLDIVFQHTLLPAESFFHTVLRNSRFCNTYVDNNLHVTNWKRKLGCKCQYKHVVDWCGCSPNDFKTEDWPRIQNTQDRQLFFARKFEPIISQEIITRVENFIGFNDHHLIPNLEAYWQSIYDTDDLTASTDDTLLTHAESIVRQNAKILLDKGCSLETDEITEINTYNYADVYKGNLILHKAFMNNGESVMMETWYKPQKHLELNFESSYTDNVKIFKVSSQYDQKEMIFRNLGSILGPLSEPNLLYRFAPHFDKQFENLTILWLDPAGVIADINYIHLEENNLTNFVKPSLKVPLLPGVWKVGLFESKSNLIALTKFLITPLQYFSGKELSHQEANIIHSGSQSAYKNFSYIKPINFLPGPDDSLLLQKISYSNTKRIQQDLREWIDGLTSEFYNVLGSCVASSSNNSDKKLTCGKHSFEYCESTEWSSLSPDPKGFVGKLNTKTGRLERV